MRLVACWLSAVFLAAAGVNSTLAADGATIVGVYQSKGGEVMGIITATDPKNKAALIAVDVKQLNQPTVRVKAGFNGAEEWREFAEIWRKARQAMTLPNSAKIGSYYDQIGHTLIDVSTGSGSIDFAIVSKRDGKLILSYFEIAPNDYDAFDQTVKTITDYFKD